MIGRLQFDLGATAAGYPLAGEVIFLRVPVAENRSEAVVLVSRNPEGEQSVEGEAFKRAQDHVGSPPENLHVVKRACVDSLVVACRVASCGVGKLMGPHAHLIAVGALEICQKRLEIKPFVFEVDSSAEDIAGLGSFERDARVAILPQIRMVQGSYRIDLGPPMGIEVVITDQSGGAVEHIPLERGKGHSGTFKGPAIVAGVVVLPVEIVGRNGD